MEEAVRVGSQDFAARLAGHYTTKTAAQEAAAKQLRKGVTKYKSQERAWALAAKAARRKNRRTMASQANLVEQHDVPPQEPAHHEAAPLEAAHQEPDPGTFHVLVRPSQERFGRG
jgi:hypothetical protein